MFSRVHVFVRAQSRGRPCSQQLPGGAVAWGSQPGGMSTGTQKRLMGWQGRGAAAGRMASLVHPVRTRGPAHASINTLASQEPGGGGGWGWVPAERRKGHRAGCMPCLGTWKAQKVSSKRERQRLSPQRPGRGTLWVVLLSRFHGSYSEEGRMAGRVLSMAQSWASSTKLPEPTAGIRRVLAPPPSCPEVPVCVPRILRSPFRFSFG